MKADLADKDVLEAKRAQHEEEVREKGKLLSEQKAVRISTHLLLPVQGCVLHLFFFFLNIRFPPLLGMHTLLVFTENKNRLNSSSSSFLGF